MRKEKLKKALESLIDALDASVTPPQTGVIISIKVDHPLEPTLGRVDFYNFNSGKTFIVGSNKVTIEIGQPR